MSDKIYGISEDGLNLTEVSVDLSDYYTKNEIFNAIYPVGSIYISINNVNPSTLFGGTWQQIASEIPIGHNVFGNGISLGMEAKNNNLYHLANGNSGNLKGYTGTGVPIGERDGQEQSTQYYTYGVIPKSTLDNKVLPYSHTGLEMEYITANLWKRTA